MPYANPESDPTALLEQLKAVLAGKEPPRQPSNDSSKPSTGSLTAEAPSNPLVARAQVAINKRTTQRRIERSIALHGPQGESSTAASFAETQLIELDHILDDPGFKNFRLTMNPASLDELKTSIDLEGLKVPIVVVEATHPGRFHVRAGFRRTLAVRHLGWKAIPAIVLPLDTPEAEEYWVNIIENTAREKLSTYELANAARMMRDRFGIRPDMFARKSSHSLDYINRLLVCIDHLPPEVLQSWQRGDRVPLDILVKLSTMTPIEAIKNLRLWFGQHRITADESLARLKKPGTVKPEKLWTITGLERTQKLMLAIKMSNLDPKTKRLAMDIVEFCQGARKRIDGVVDENHRLPAREFILPDPEPDEIIPSNPQNRTAAPTPIHELHPITPGDFAPTLPGKPRTSS